MRNFNFLDECEEKELFYKMPQCYLKTVPKEILRIAVGALLYIPASNEKISEIIVSQKIKCVSSISICLEDAIGDDNRQKCVENAKSSINKIYNEIKSGNMDLHKLPLIFVRVKNTQMLCDLKQFFIEKSEIVTGVILPKVTCESLEADLKIIDEINKSSKDVFYAMPILESEELLNCDCRIGILKMYKNITDRYYDYILNIRVGATDLCGLYGIRRDKYTSIHNIDIINRCLCDVVQIFGFRDKYTISAPVWEYFSNPISLAENSTEIEGLISETILNIQNGFIGKTVVHPLQLIPVQSVCCVEFEEYNDACTVINTDKRLNGVVSSFAKNKMNEVKPHEIWAEKIIKRAEIYGVYNKNKCFEDLLNIYREREIVQWKQ